MTDGPGPALPPPSPAPPSVHHLPRGNNSAVPEPGVPENNLKSTKVTEVRFYCTTRLHSGFYYNVNKSLTCVKV